MRIEEYTAARGEALARFWNEEFAAFPRFRAATAGWLEERLARASGRPLLALDGEAVVGIAHAGVSPEAECRARLAGWRGGTQGYLALLAVARGRRRSGIGTALWHAARAGVVAASSQFVIDGEGRNPWWSRPPAFGAPWGPAVPWGDSATKKFLATRGFGPRAKAVEFADGVMVPDADPEAYERRVREGAAKVAEWALY